MFASGRAGHCAGNFITIIMCLSLVLNADCHIPLCSRNKVVLLTGLIRGNNYTWSSIIQNLILPNDADVVLDIWSGSQEQHKQLVTLFQPCVFFSENFDVWLKRARYRNWFKVYNDNLYIEDPQEAVVLKNSIYQFYRVWHSFTLLSKSTAKSPVVIRSRLDSFYASPVAIPAAIPPNTVFGDLAWGGISYEDDDNPKSCPKMINDQFSYGDFWGMSIYHDVYLHMKRLHDYMKTIPGYRKVWTVQPVFRHNSTFLECPESFLAFRLRMSAVSCRNIPIVWCLARNVSGNWHC